MVKSRTPKQPRTRPPWSRHNRLEVNFNDGEMADLKILAEAWGLTKRAVVWGVISTWLSNLRDRDVLKLPYTKESQAILQKMRYEERKANHLVDQEQCKENPGESWEEPGYRVRLRKGLPRDPEED